MYWDVVEVKPAGCRTLAVRFADGLAGTIHLDAAYCAGVFSSVLDDALFEQATVQDGAITWPNGLDLAPDTMYKEIRQSPSRHYEVGVHLALV